MMTYNGNDCVLRIICQKLTSDSSILSTKAIDVGKYLYQKDLP